MRLFFGLVSINLIGHTFWLGSQVAVARSLWSSVPATHGDQSSAGYLFKTGYPVGNGRLGAVPFGLPGAEKAVLNIDSLWSGGPFENQSYTGGNPAAEKYSALPSIRANIFKNGTGNVNALLGDGNNYGSYQVLANFSVELDGAQKYTDYRRTLDLKTGVHSTTFVSNSQNFSTSIFCSYPAQVCVYSISTETGSLPSASISLENTLVPATNLSVGCGDGFVRLTGYTQPGAPQGMKYQAIVRVISSAATTKCSCGGRALKVTPAAGQKSLAVVIGAGTNYDATKGNAGNSFSFKGADPGAYVESVTEAAATKSYPELLTAHIQDYSALGSAFELNLPDIKNSADRETSAVMSSYNSSGTSSDPYLEALLFDLSRHLLISSSRDNSLPANLQGRWGSEISMAWGADYHANINLQMNYWAADQTGLSATQSALWNYMEQTWVPRGHETARLLYNSSSSTGGWVVHDEMNIFGHTAMKNDAQWANYPAAAAWMMQHVWDAFEYTQDAAWFAEQGYPLIKGVAKFWLSQLQDDAFTKDGSLVVNPCNSPEHGPTTFGCAHYQQEIHQVFEAVLAGAPVAGETDSAFTKQVAASLSKLDKGLSFTSWGGIKEWKLPDSYGLDVQNDTHRHLSHLTGWHPGYALSSFQGGYFSNITIQSAVRQTLLSRGRGNAADANAGWAKVWRAACWARLNDSARAYDELTYAIQQNFAPNGLSMYSGHGAPFQIDANFGLGGAVLAMLVVDLPVSSTQAVAVGRRDVGARTVALGPAIPDAWGGGSVKGLRIRGGGSVDFSWDGKGIVNRASLRGSKTTVRLVNVRGDVLAESGQGNR